MWKKLLASLAIASLGLSVAVGGCTRATCARSGDCDSDEYCGFTTDDGCGGVGHCYSTPNCIPSGEACNCGASDQFISGDFSCPAREPVRMGICEPQRPIDAGLEATALDATPDRFGPADASDDAGDDDADGSSDCTLPFIRRSLPTPLGIAVHAPETLECEGRGRPANRAGAPPRSETLRRVRASGHAKRSSQRDVGDVGFG